MSKKNLLAIILLMAATFSQFSFAMKTKELEQFMQEQIEPEKKLIATPSKKILAELFSHFGLNDFAQKTSAIKQLSSEHKIDKTYCLNAYKVLETCLFFEYKKKETNPEIIEVARKNINKVFKKIIEIIENTD